MLHMKVFSHANGFFFAISSFPIIDKITSGLPGFDDDDDH